MKKEITWCDERALKWPPPVGVRGVVLSLFILTILKNRFALIRHTFTSWDMENRLPGSPKLSSHRRFVADQALDVVLRTGHRGAADWTRVSFWEGRA
jgi:hypothetical protein